MNKKASGTTYLFFEKKNALKIDPFIIINPKVNFLS